MDFYLILKQVVDIIKYKFANFLTRLIHTTITVVMSLDRKDASSMSLAPD